MSAALLPHVPAPGEAPPLGTLVNAYPWLQPLADTPQDPVFHAEGDVWTHTAMALKALTGLEAWGGRPETDRQALFWATLLHDIAKPRSTVTDPDGRVRSPGHAVRGERLARALLWTGIPEPVPFPLRERVVKLVRYHGLPLSFLKKPDPRRALIEASQFVPLEQLALVAEADVLGRICPDRDELLDTTALFRDYARELGCYRSPYPFPSPLGRFHYLSRRSDDPGYQPFDDSWGGVLLLSGLPGAGKDSWLEQNRPELPVVSLDAIRDELGVRRRDPQGTVLQRARERARGHLRARQPFAWNATNLFRPRRKVLVDLVVNYGARAHILYLEPAFEQLLERNRSRLERVPERILRRYLDRFDLPDLSEAPEVTHHTSDD